MCRTTINNLGNEYSVVSLDVLVAYTSSDAKPEPYIVTSTTTRHGFPYWRPLLTTIIISMGGGVV